MSRANDREPMDDVLTRARAGGRKMARMDLARGESDPRMILWSIERDCREVGADWGLSPAAEESVIRAYLEGAREVLAGRRAARRPPEVAPASPEEPRLVALVAFREDLRQLRAWAWAIDAEAREAAARSQEVVARSREVAAQSRALLADITSRHRTWALVAEARSIRA